VLPGAHQAHVLAEPILELAKPDLFHGPNVASWSLIVKRPTNGRVPTAALPSGLALARPGG
jgi:hypothetical protein